MYIGVDVGGTNLVAALTDASGNIANKVSCPVNKSWSAEETSFQITQLARRAAITGNCAPEKIEAVGIGFPGLVDNKTGYVIKTPNMSFNNTPFRTLFQAEWDVPVYLGNDANCAAIGEYWAGAAKGCDPAVVITLGTGIGGGFIANQKLLTGFANSGMEVGHMIIHPNGFPCGCGNHGCWEQYGSATALIRMTKEAMAQSASSILWALCDGDISKVQGKTTFQAAELSDSVAQKVLDTYLDGLALGLANLVNILQPEIICLGGGISHASENLLLNPLRELVKQNVFDKKVPLRIEQAALGNDAGVIGAAMLCNMV